jgi:hypothetical protein
VELFINDLSLHGQFQGVQDFRTSFEGLLRCRSCSQTFGRPCYVPRQISRRMVAPNLSFRQAITSIGNLDLTRRVMAWINQHGPFADDVLTRSANEYYAYGDEVVTEEILGEAAARYFADRPTALVSLAPSDFEHSSLEVTWHRNDTELASSAINNFWDDQQLHRFLEQCEAEVQNWPEMLGRAQSRFRNLTFLDRIDQHLAGEPFSSTIARRTLELLDILDRLKAGYTAAGERTAEGEQLIENYFRRKNAAFTDASESEKNNANHRAAMTFRLPDGEMIECFWHGKISHRFFRIHFSPIAYGQPLYIAYIGPKLTKS